MQISKIQKFLPGSPSKGTALLLCLDPPGLKNLRRDMIFSSAFPALNGGRTVEDMAMADCDLRDGDSDLDLKVTLPAFSGRRGHSHMQWYSLAWRLWLWCLGAGDKMSSSSVSELVSVWKRTALNKTTGGSSGCCLTLVSIAYFKKLHVVVIYMYSPEVQALACVITLYSLTKDT